MKPSKPAVTATAIIRARGKMYEYKVPSEHHNKLPEGMVLEEVFPLAIGILGDFAAETARKYLDIPPGNQTDVVCIPYPFSSSIYLLSPMF